MLTLNPQQPPNWHSRFEGYPNFAAFTDAYQSLLIDEARRQALEEAVSYRGFLVGAVGVMYAADARLGFVETGANDSPVKGVGKSCAEMHLLLRQMEHAERYGRCVLRVVYVASNADETGIRSVMQEPADPCLATVLPPCFDCQDWMRDHPEAWDESTTVTMLGTNKHIRPVTMPLSNVLELHASRNRPPTSKQLHRGKLVAAAR